MNSEQLIFAPAYQKLAERLRAEIVSGRLKPGERLPTEPQLCISTGLSRSTVREALRLLASEHLITTVRGVSGGSFITYPSPSMMAESLSTGLKMLMSCGPVDGHQLFEVRELVEVPATGLAALRATPEDVAILRATLCDPHLSDLDTLLVGGRLFHTTLMRASGNPVLEIFTQPLYSVSNEREIAAHWSLEFWDRLQGDHRVILEAIEARDPGSARFAAAAHLRHLHEHYAEISRLSF